MECHYSVSSFQIKHDNEHTKSSEEDPTMDVPPQPQSPYAQRDLRLELRIKNNILWHAIYDHFPSTAAFCRTHPRLFSKSDTHAISALLHFKRQPQKKSGGWTALALRMEQALRLPAELLFPMHLYERVATSKRIVEVSSFAALPQTVRAEIRRLPAPVESPLDAASREELRERLAEVIDTLSFREREILKMRFGLVDHPSTYNEISRCFNITRERIRQIELRALEKMQHSSRAHLLAEFLESRPQT